MRFAAAGRTLAVLTVVCCGNAVAQPALPGSSATLPPTTNVLTVPAGESLVLELKSPLNSGSARKGDRADFSTTSETLVGDQVAIPRGTIVRATITQAKRAGAMRKPQLQFEFNEIVLPNRTVQPMAANLTHGAWSRPRGEYSRRNGSIR